MYSTMPSCNSTDTSIVRGYFEVVSVAVCVASGEGSKLIHGDEVVMT